MIETFVVSLVVTAFILGVIVGARYFDLVNDVEEEKS